MTIILQKFSNKSPVLRCIREDGSETFQSYGGNGAFFAIHDLTHYAVETELGFTKAFFGMLADGRDASDFGPGDSAAFDDEANWSEVLSGILTTTNGVGCSMTNQEVIDAVAEKLMEMSVPPLSLDEATLERIRVRSAELADQWMKVPTDGSMTLPWPAKS